MDKETALIAGATGLVGNLLLHKLLANDSYHEVIAVLRRKTLLKHPKLQQIVVDFDRLDEVTDKLKADDYYCCMGTTMKKAGSKENFAKVDYLYPVNLASIAQLHKAEKYMIITAMGADKNSWFYYNKVKGEVEEEISQKKIDSVYIFRPSLILGDRKEERFGEEFAQTLSGPLSLLFAGPLKEYKPIEADDIANGMARMSQSQLKGVHVFSSEEIKTLS